MLNNILTHLNNEANLGEILRDHNEIEIKSLKGGRFILVKGFKKVGSLFKRTKVDVYELFYYIPIKEGHAYYSEITIEHDKYFEVNNLWESLLEIIDLREQKAYEEKLMEYL